MSRRAYHTPWPTPRRRSEPGEHRLAVWTTLTLNWKSNERRVACHAIGPVSTAVRHRRRRVPGGATGSSPSQNTTTHDWPPTAATRNAPAKRNGATAQPDNMIQQRIKRNGSTAKSDNMIQQRCQTKRFNAAAKRNGSAALS